MNKFTLCFLAFLLTSILGKAQKIAMDYYLPGISFDKSVPSPKEVFGFQPGEWHLSHDQIVRYLTILAEKSPRVTIEQYAVSHEYRPLLLLTITSAENQQNIQLIKNQHIALTDPNRSEFVDLNRLPSVIYQGYSVHGNESSGANAAVLYAYYLAAGKGKKVERLLDEVVVLLDPVMNPDGVQRFSNWVNMHKSKNLVSDPNSIEFDEKWPGGRTNHYWFDLNRDWLLLQHPESRGRIQKFHEWKPNILTDHHEMSTNSTFFFQPGVPSRTNPLTPEINQELTQKIGNYHAAALDQIGSLYYSKESFDDFYYGKGSTYPDVNGCIGILFEQASSRGHLQESIHGPLSFPFTIRNQLATSLSTLEAAKEMRNELLRFKKSFFRSALDDAQKDDTKAYVFGEEKDPARLNLFLQLLKRHQIKVYELSRNSRINGQSFTAREAYIVPLDQVQYRMVKAIFQQITSFKDSLFYDVSSWTLPLAYNLSFSAIDKKDFNAAMIGAEYPIIRTNTESNEVVTFSNYAYIFEWQNYFAPKALQKLFDEKVRVKVATSNFSFMIPNLADPLKRFTPGTIIIPVENQDFTAEEIYRIIQRISKSCNIQFFSTKTGVTHSGSFLGSPGFKNLEVPKALMLIGSGVRAYDAGEVWHLMDQRYDMKLTMADVYEVARMDLNDYNTIILADGNYSKLGESGIKKLKEWLSNGGNLICMEGAVRWAKGAQISNVSWKEKPKEKTKKKKKRKAYADRAGNAGAAYIGGAIFEAQLDLTHPLAYGFDRDKLPVFRSGTSFMDGSNNEYATPLAYTDAPLLGGYISKDNLKMLSESAAIIVSSYGSGRVINMIDNPNFRGFWYGTNKLFCNALFFAPIISRASMESAPAKKGEKKTEAALDDGHGH